MKAFRAILLCCLAVLGASALIGCATFKQNPFTSQAKPKDVEWWLEAYEYPIADGFKSLGRH